MAPKFDKTAPLPPVHACPVTLPEPLGQWAGTSTDYPRDRTVASLFEQVAASHPDNVALVFNETQLTYSQLNLRANRVAHQLIRMGVGPEMMVGCCFQRSVDLVVALLAILKAGGAYVPLDPSYPRERLDFLLNDTCAPLILTQKSLASTILSGGDRPILLTDNLGPTSSSRDDINPTPSSGPTTLAYVMYTSGSTGRPKGVMVENRAIARLVRNTNYCSFGPGEVFLQFAPISFDASTFEIWGPLLNGGRLVIMPPQDSSLEDLGRTIRAQGVTTLWLTSALFNLVVEQRLEDLGPLRQLLVGGDVLSARHVRTCLENLPNLCLVNGYGPTENTTFTCCHVMHAGDLVPEPVPIGRPVSNTQVFILDENMRPLPVGRAGELFAAGDGLARGYLKDPEETAQKFVAGPFGEGRRLYRTGDIARWREDGTIEFLGRLDDQIKLLGYRIEPREIESALGTHPNIQQVCVLPQATEDGSSHLVAFYIPAVNSALTSGQLREFAKEKLPQYMIPAKFQSLNSFPLSPNGKLDRAALAKLNTSAENLISSPAPSSQLEASLTHLWQRLLRHSRVGLDDNFFDIGGDSLLLLAMHSHLQKAFSSDIPIAELFRFPTIRELARHLNDKNISQPAFAKVQQQARSQRKAFARMRAGRQGGGA